MVDNWSSICSAMSKASTASISRYRTVLSSFVWPRRSCTACRFPVFRFAKADLTCVSWFGEVSVSDQPACCDYKTAKLWADWLRQIPVSKDHAIDVALLERAIADDRRRGLQPFLIVGTAGTVDIGAIDGLKAFAAIASRESVWFHVDGAFGALGMLTPEIAPRLSGIERADSLAFDFHKWGQVPCDASFILVRDGRRHRATFTNDAAYLRRETRGLAAGSPWFCDFGPDPEIQKNCGARQDSNLQSDRYERRNIDCLVDFAAVGQLPVKDSQIVRASRSYFVVSAMALAAANPSMSESEKPHSSSASRVLAPGASGGRGKAGLVLPNRGAGAGWTTPSMSTKV